MAEFRRKLLTLMLLTGLSVTVAQAAAGAQFGIGSFNAALSNSQAGAHADFTASFAMNTDSLGNPIGEMRNAAVTLPPGLIGNPQAIERCSIQEFQRSRCPSASQVGFLEPTVVECPGFQSAIETPVPAGATTITVASTKGFCGGPYGTLTIGTGASAETVQLAYALDSHTLELAAPLTYAHESGEMVSEAAGTDSSPLPVFNLPPSPGHLATFGVSLFIAAVLIQVDEGRSGGLVATMSDLSTLVPLEASTLTLWGVPADQRHDSQRCSELGPVCGKAPSSEPTAFMTNPTDCSAPGLQTGLSLTSWDGQTAASSASMPAPSGCEKLAIAPQLTVAAASTRRDMPSGYEVDLKVPQHQEPYGLATPELKNISVTLPAGTSLSPPLANGLQDCTEAEFGSGDCPDAAKVGTAEITTPLLADRLTGALYIGTPTAGEKYRLFVLLHGDNTTVGMIGQVEPNEATGQLTTVFGDAPQLPFSDFKLNFFGGPAAALANPAVCGAAVSSSAIESYSGQTADPTSTFEINESAEGGACVSNAPFTPTFVSGVSNPMAGGFSPFTLTVAREDGQPDLSGFSAKLPTGLVAALSSVPACQELQASQGTCSQASQIGTAVIWAGPGALPIYATGPVYLTGPYHGAPYGLSVLINASGSPFNLGTLNIRSRVMTDRSDLALEIASDQLPQMVAGIPLRLRGMNVTLNRPDFLRNPTSCRPQAVTGEVESAGGQDAAVSSPFQVVGCDELHFAPRLTVKVRTQLTGHELSASLGVHLANPAGENASLRSLSIKLPKQLRPRLVNTQHACLQLSAVFSPAACPKASVIGHMTLSTPLVAVPLSAAIYLVARGKSVAPELVMLLEGQGISAELSGELLVGSNGQASAVFNDLPDLPINTIDLLFPSGPGSLLGATEKLCSKHLALDYRLTDQSGAAIQGASKVAIVGCPTHAHKPVRHSAKTLRRKRA